VSGARRSIAALVMATGPDHRADPPSWAWAVDGKPALLHTVDRMSRVNADRLAVVAPHGGDAAGRRELEARLAGLAEVLDVDVDPRPDAEARLRLARAWSPSSWRGGIGGATCYDEWLDPRVAAAAMETLDADAAVLVAPDWPLVDPAWCDRLIDRHLELPEKHRMVFSQAAPGFCGVLLEKALAREMADHATNVGWMLDYNPAAPKVDPVGRDVCVQVPPELRAPGVRATTDRPRWAALVDAAGEAGAADDAVAAARAMTARLRDRGHALPQQVAVELTPRRATRGPASPGGLVDAGRDAMTPRTFAAISDRLADVPDLALTFGGLGDPLCHPAFEAFVEAAPPHAAIAWETDLLAGADAIDRLSAIDRPMVVKVRLNAATAAAYEQVMGVDRFDEAIANLGKLANATRPTGAPIWVLPAMVKCRQNVHELEPFVERWQSMFGTALVEGPRDGGGLVEDVAVIDMAPPRRFACRQLAHRLTVLSDGTAARCDEDWLGREPAGRLDDEPLETVWARIQQLRRDHEAGSHPGPCGACRQWHRP